MRRSHSSEADSKAPAPERVLRRLGSLLDMLSGRRAINLWIPRSRIEQASRLRSRTLSDWSWLWWQPCRYIRLWRAGRDLTNQRREVHNRLLLSRSASDPDLVDLNEAQRRAVVNLDDRVFVTAGAGSGKTWVIVEKVRHVVRQGAARPDEIAVITFTNKATEAVRSRLQDIDGVAVETIHGLAMQVIERQGLGRPQISPLANDKNTHRRLTLLSRALDETLAEKPEMFLEVYERGEAFLRHHGSGDSARLPLVPPGDTAVRSLGEARIALTLYACGVAYQYERELVVPERFRTHDGRRYHPDFFIPDDPDETNPPPEAGIWLEHYSHDRHGNLPPEYLEQDRDAHRRYDEEHKWKRRVFAAMRLRYVETTYGDIEYESAGDESFSHLLVRRLNAHRRAPISVPDPHHVNTLLRNVVAREGKGARRIAKEIDAWIRAWRQRSSRRRQKVPPGLGRDAQSAALALERLARPVMARWEQHLKNTKTEDFEGVILRATRVLATPRAKSPWKVVLLDEAQDVNPAQADFVEALTGRPSSDNPEHRARFTAVGDAWQAIFGFQGGDPGYLDEGGTERDPESRYASRINLEQTYRHAQPLAQTARAYVLRQTSARDRIVQADAQGFSDTRWPGAVSLGSCRLTPQGRVILGDADGASTAEGTTAGLLCVLTRIQESRARVDDRKQGSVLVLCRQNAGLTDRALSLDTRSTALLQDWDTNPAKLPDYLWGKSRAELRTAAEQQARKQEGFHCAAVRAAAAKAGVKIGFATVHKAKGLETDYTIVLDAGPGTAAEQAEVRARDEALAPIRGRLSEAEEEHRIGYVALTRARRKTYLLLTGTGEERSLWGHTLWRNEHREYDVSEEELVELLEPLRPSEPCPACKLSGTHRETLVLRNGRNGLFVGCTSYGQRQTSCGHTERACEKCGNGIMVRDRHGLSRCHDRRCGWEAPLCGCRVPKPMKVKSRHVDGQRFLGCQDYGPSGGCSETEILAWRERPTERRWWNVSRMGRFLDVFGHFTENEKGEVVLNFGRHEGDVASQRRDFLEWMQQQDFPEDTLVIVEEVLSGIRR